MGLRTISLGTLIFANIDTHRGFYGDVHDDETTSSFSTERGASWVAMGGEVGSAVAFHPARKEASAVVRHRMSTMIGFLIRPPGFDLKCLRNPRSSEKKNLPV